MTNKTTDSWYKTVLKGYSLNGLMTRYSSFLVICFHLFSVVFAYLTSFYIRFDFKVPSEDLVIFFSTLPLLLISRMASYYYYRTHTASWRFAYLRDLVDIIKAIFLGSALFLALMVFLNRINEFPRSVFLLEALLSLATMSGTKLLVRYHREYRSLEPSKSSKHILIVGAGKAGVLLLNEIRYNIELGIHVVGFVDDNPGKKGRYFQGVPVLGRSEDIPKLVKQNAIDEIIVAIPSARYKDIVRITRIAEDLNIKTMVLPSLGDLIQEGSFTNQLRDVNFDDLLCRRVIQFSRDSDRKALYKEIGGKAVLVTGAGGSIGSELCRQIVQFNPRIMILYERYENSLYELELELKHRFHTQPILPVIGDICDTDKLREVIQTNKVNLIYHAAAYKHVPMMEREPIEAVRNNVIGTFSVSRLAVESDVDKFILISTDKAVNPMNVMGLTKRVAELIVNGLNGKRGTKFIAVRFGNVIGSNGSVIPLFRKQIVEGGPLTVTHPDATRYFMAIREAVQLVMTSGTMGDGGELFLLDMGEPIKIIDIAKNLIKLSGLEPERDVDIVFTGLRPGEKLHEELYWHGEGIVPTENKKITLLKQNETQDYNDFFVNIDRLVESAKKGNKKETIEILTQLVPEATIEHETFES